MTERAIRSRKYLDASRGQPCTLRIPGLCDGGGESTVAAHILDRHAGRGIKASDISVADSCSACHAKFDGQAGEPLSHEDWLFYALRGLQETLENRIGRGIVDVPQDQPKPFAARPTKPRAPKAERKPIAQRENAWPPKGSRKIPTRKTLEARQ
jgi:hypothetical protein